MVIFTTNTIGAYLLSVHITELIISLFSTVVTDISRYLLSSDSSTYK